MAYPSDTVEYIEGGLLVDDRGEVVFVNGFHFEGVKRFYAVRNHQRGFIRAWHAHRREAKYVLVPEGAALIGIVKIDNFDHPDSTIKPERFVLSAHKPGILYIPSGYANGAMSLTADTTILYFSTSPLEESKGDDYRYDAKYWDIWHVEAR